jgi:hypothetical protein
MEWISEHLLQIVIALAAAIAAFLNNRKKDKDGEPADYDGDGIPDNRKGRFETSQMELDEAERTRRLQEEIRRKIAERRSGQTPPAVAPRPVAKPVPEVIQRRFENRGETPPPPQQERRRISAAAQAERDAEVLERQRAMEEQLRLLDARRAETRRVAAEAAAPRSAEAAYRTKVSGTASGPALLADLRSPGGARRAWILREVLDTPVGLR